METLKDFFLELARWFLQQLWEIVVLTVNFLIETFVAFITWVLSLFPSYTVPTPATLTETYPFLSPLNYFFPIDFAVSCVTMYIFSLTLYYSIGVLLRWARVIR